MQPMVGHADEILAGGVGGAWKEKCIRPRFQARSMRKINKKKAVARSTKELKKWYREQATSLNRHYPKFDR